MKSCEEAKNQSVIFRLYVDEYEFPQLFSVFETNLSFKDIY